MAVEFDYWVILNLFWSEIRCVYTINWVKGESGKLKMIVRNRIEEMWSLSNPSSWFHCPGQDNPVDILTRGLKVSEIKKNAYGGKTSYG